MMKSKVSAFDIKGIGFDATCSLVVLDANYEPVSLTDDYNTKVMDSPVYNVIMWMDHRAEVQAKKINETKHDLLKYVGDHISLEMEPPKILWLKENLGHSFMSKVCHIFDLPDFLTFKATGSLSRSKCSLTCKFLYNAPKNCWDVTFWEAIGLPEVLLDRGDVCCCIGSQVSEVGECVGELHSDVAMSLGFETWKPAVGTSIIDAYAGALGVLFCQSTSIDLSIKNVPLTQRLLMIAGTSTCHMLVKDEPVFVKGVWGPFYETLVPGMWVSEAGQSAAGKLIDHIVSRLSTFAQNCEDYSHVESVLVKLSKDANMSNIDFLTRSVHVWPDFHGNRSPLSDPSLRGMISGLNLSNSEEEWAVLYLAAIQALAYGTKHIIKSLETASGGSFIKVICMTGGLTKNPLYVQTHANVTGLPIVIPYCEDSVLLGSAMIGAMASLSFDSFQDAAFSMCGSGSVVHPQISVASYHEKKYMAFQYLLDCQYKIRAVMNE